MNCSLPGEEAFSYNNPISLPEIRSEDLPACICGLPSKLVCRLCYRLSFCSHQCKNAERILKHKGVCSQEKFPGKELFLRNLHKAAEKDRSEKEGLDGTRNKSPLTKINDNEVEQPLRVTNDLSNGRNDDDSNSSLDSDDSECPPFKYASKVKPHLEEKRIVSKETDPKDKEDAMAVSSGRNCDGFDDVEFNNVGHLYEDSDDSDCPPFKYVSKEESSLDFMNVDVDHHYEMDLKDKEETIAEVSNRISNGLDEVESTNDCPTNEDINDSDSPAFRHGYEQEFNNEEKNSGPHDKLDLKSIEIVDTNNDASDESLSPFLATSYNSPKEKHDDIKQNLCTKVIGMEDPSDKLSDFSSRFFNNIVKRGMSETSTQTISNHSEETFPKHATVDKFTSTEDIGEFHSQATQTECIKQDVGVQDQGTQTDVSFEKFKLSNKIASVQTQDDFIDNNVIPVKEHSMKIENLLKKSPPSVVEETIKKLNSTAEHVTSPVMLPSVLKARVILQDGCLIKIKDIGKSSKYVKIRCVEEPERKQLEEIISPINISRRVLEPLLGSFVAVKNTSHEKYPRFVRGEVRKIFVSKKEVVCQLVDYHDELTVPFSNLFHLPEAALYISPMCFTVILEDVPNMSRKEAKPKLLNFQQYLSEEFILKLVDESSLVVKLLDKKFRSVNDLISRILTDKDFNFKHLCDSSRKMETPNTDSPWSDDLFVLGDELNTSKISSYHNLPIGHVRTVVLHHKAPYIFVCTQAAYENLIQLQVNMQYLAKNVARVPFDQMKLFVNQLIMFQASDEHWYRGIVTKMSKSKYYIFAPDYGFSEKIPMGAEAKLQPVFCEEFMRMKYFASPCTGPCEIGQLNDLEVINLNIIEVINNIMYSVDII